MVQRYIENKRKREIKRSVRDWARMKETLSRGIPSVNSYFFFLFQINSIEP